MTTKTADFTAEQIRGMTEREVAVLQFCISQFDDLSRKDWRDHGFRLATFESMKSKLVAVVESKP